MNIDLGSKEVANVKFNGNTYELGVPTVPQAEKFVEALKENEGSEFKVFKDFAISLGLPPEVAEELTVNQYQILANGLMGMTEKK